MYDFHPDWMDKKDLKISLNCAFEFFTAVGMQYILYDYSYLWTYDLNGPICNVFDVGKSLPMALVMELPKSKTLYTGPNQSEVHR